PQPANVNFSPGMEGEVAERNVACGVPRVGREAVAQVGAREAPHTPVDPTDFDSRNDTVWNQARLECEY
ncbi:MAG TPA: hypothetical protein VGV15_11080, partial [Terriglobales bacterium]|nr:hypothetical protein [Terriglobales bacterium]